MLRREPNDDESLSHGSQQAIPCGSAEYAGITSEDPGHGDNEAYIQYPGKHDVMLGRGGDSNYHSGNLNFRQFVKQFKEEYQAAPRNRKPDIALKVVKQWRSLDPPGRFLVRTHPERADSLWHEVGDETAAKRALKNLGERDVTKPRARQASKAKGKTARKNPSRSSEDDKLSNSHTVGLTELQVEGRAIVDPQGAHELRHGMGFASLPSAICRSSTTSISSSAAAYAHLSVVQHHATPLSVPLQLQMALPPAPSVALNWLDQQQISGNRGCDVSSFQIDYPVLGGNLPKYFQQQHEEEKATDNMKEQLPTAAALAESVFGGSRADDSSD